MMNVDYYFEKLCMDDESNDCWLSIVFKNDSYDALANLINSHSGSLKNLQWLISRAGDPNIDRLGSNYVGGVEVDGLFEIEQWHPTTCLTIGPKVFISRSDLLMILKDYETAYTDFEKQKR